MNPVMKWTCGTDWWNLPFHLVIAIDFQISEKQSRIKDMLPSEIYSLMIQQDLTGFGVIPGSIHHHCGGCAGNGDFWLKDSCFLCSFKTRM